MQNARMRDDDLEALIKLKALLETESWTEDYHYPPTSGSDDNDDGDCIPQDCIPDNWTFISTNGTAFRGKWVNRNASRTNPRDSIIVDLVPKGERGRRYGEDYKARCVSMYQNLLQEVQLCMNPPWNVLPDEADAWREQTGGWHLKVQDTETHCGRKGVDFVVCTKDGKNRVIEKLLVATEVNSKGIDVWMFLANPRWIRWRGNRDVSRIEEGLLHFLILFFGDERWEVMGPPPPPSPVKGAYQRVA
ncbi:hypothetical protein FA13DRAFT_1863643 [Coprinellus micaceus]|uniref:Uncharacterized protein n=1 Tax=Coprinellus micaceus TaxID=71717 RepID=A0A4Y7T5J7_COPMI|nr:hypothetical protein FA13DRAFT_1863643 [Coprinellus micaceus]